VLGDLIGRPSPWAAIHSRPWRIALGFCAFELAYFAAYYFGMWFDPVIAAPMWFPDAVLLCALLCVRRSWWWLLLVSILPIRLLVQVPVDTPAWFLAAVYFNDCGKAVLAALLLRRFLEDPLRLQSLRDFGLYFLFAVVLVPALSALAGGATRAALGDPFLPSFEQWLLGNSLASLVVTPILFYWLVRPPHPAGLSARQALEAAVICAGLIVSLRIAFGTAEESRYAAETRFYLPVPFMVWAAMRFRMRGATAVAALLSLFVVKSALHGTGSFANVSSAEASSLLQHFLLLRVAPLYLVAVLIEQWMRANHSLRESEHRFRNIADTAPVMVWTSRTDAGLDFCNRTWLAFTGRALDESLGSRWAQSLHPEDRQRTLEEYLGGFRERRPLQLEFRMRRHDGEYRWISSHGAPRYGVEDEFMGYVGTAIDLTERRHQEAALKRSEARYRDLVESQANFVCRLLPDGSLTFVNAAYCRFLGRARLELLGSDFVELQPSAARRPTSEALQRVQDCGQQATWDCEVAHADGTRGWQSWVCQVIEGVPDEVREIQAIGYDVTDRRRAEEAGRRLAHAARLAAVGELTAMVAHEINQPLCAILSNAEAGEILLRAEQPPLGELRDILADIRKDDLRADAAIRGIRSLLQRRESELTTVDLVATVNHVFRLMAGDALHRRVPIRQELEARLPPVKGDRSSIEQILVILMVNGMEAMLETPESARDLLVSARRVDGDRVEVAVLDRGHGIAAANLPQLFDSFFTTKPDGMGMGLSIARSMVAAQGGRIWAEDAPEGGAAFRLTLAIAPAVTPD
jgi:PAS domain S-box-containing protein